MAGNLPDLRALYGTKYRTTYEESYFADRSELARTHEPYLMVVLCRHGHIFLNGPDVLGASTDRRGAIARRLCNLPGIKVVQDGDDGINAVFSPDLFDSVAKIMKPRRRRRLNDEQKKAASERLRQYQFKKGE